MELKRFLKESYFHLIVWSLAALLYSPVLHQLYSARWKMVDYTHAYFILPVSLWLAWRKRLELAKLCGKAHPLGLPLIVFGLLSFLLGWRWDYMAVTSFSLIPLLFGLTLYLYGAAMARALAFPILYLLLMVPPPMGVIDSITLPMRHGISVATAVTLKLVGYPMVRDGLLLSMGGHDIYMGAPCSGLRSLITMLSLGLVYVYINKGSLKKKAVMLASVLPLALFGNYVRVIGMCLFTYYVGGEAAQKYFHDYSGIVIFVVMILGLLGIERLLERVKFG
jgi:exosortase